MKAGLLSAVATSVFILSTLASSAFAGSTILVSSSVSSNNFGSHFPFVDINFDQFFGQFFGRNLKASMDGPQEIPGPGDPDGTGQASVRLKPDKTKFVLISRLNTLTHQPWLMSTTLPRVRPEQL